MWWEVFLTYFGFDHYECGRTYRNAVICCMFCLWHLTTWEGGGWEQVIILYYVIRRLFLDPPLCLRQSELRSKEVDEKRLPRLSDWLRQGGGQDHLTLSQSIREGSGQQEVGKLIWANLIYLRCAKNPCKLNFRCLIKIFESRPQDETRYSGYLITADDIVLLPEKMTYLDKNAAWLDGGTAFDSLETGNTKMLHSFLLNDCYTYTYKCPILRPLVPLFWMSDDISAGFQSQCGFYSIPFCGGKCNVHSLRSISRVTPADLLTSDMVDSCFRTLIS